MPSGTAIFFTVVAGIIAALAGYIYVFGIPPQLKRDMEDKALETMGENKASYMMKGSSYQLGTIETELVRLTTNADTISRVPASDQKDVKDLQTGIGNALGGSLQNPLGKQLGSTGDRLTSPLTGR